MATIDVDTVVRGKTVYFYYFCISNFVFLSLDLDNFEFSLMKVYPYFMPLKYTVFKKKIILNFLFDKLDKKLKVLLLKKM